MSDCAKRTSDEEVHGDEGRWDGTRNILGCFWLSAAYLSSDFSSSACLSLSACLSGSQIGGASTCPIRYVGYLLT